MGEKAVEVLGDVVASGALAVANTVLPTRLVFRASCGCGTCCSQGGEATPEAGPRSEPPRSSRRDTEFRLLRERVDRRVEACRDQ